MKGTEDSASSPIVSLAWRSIRRMDILRCGSWGSWCRKENSTSVQELEEPSFTLREVRTFR